jgi:hypothetical protein
MRTPGKQFEARSELIFSGLRWPGAEAAGRQHLTIPRADGSLTTHSGFVTIVVFGDVEGRKWAPEPTDATWRSLAELDLDSFPDSAAFVRRRGDPYGALKPGNSHITTSQWIYLAEALRIAAVAWQPADATGTSYPTTDRAKLLEAGRFLQNAGAAPMLATLAVVPNSSGVGLSLAAPSLAAFLIARAALALARPLPMRRCTECGFWFEVRRIQRQPRFCSASCRALNHQNQESQDGVSPQEHHQQRNRKVAVGLATAGAGRQDATANKKLRKPKGRARSRAAHGTRGRAPRRRRPAKT